MRRRRFWFVEDVRLLGRKRLLDAEKMPFQGGEPIPKGQQGATAQLLREPLNTNKGGDGENRSNDEQNDSENGKKFHFRGWILRRGD